MTGAYYNELDSYCAAWLRNLVAAGHIPAGDVDERDIRDVDPVDLLGYTQCHFFSGVAVWPYALRLAGFPEDRECWTGSCPCQPWSASGKRAGFDDERHLWPAWFELIRVMRPTVVFGEQVASSSAGAWLDHVFDDMEGAGYACGAVDLPACGVGAPHIRQRLFWVADADHAERRAGAAGGHDRDRQDAGRAQGPGDVEGRGGAGDGAGGAGPVNGFWRDADWLLCRDGKRRPARSGSCVLAHGIANRVGKLRAYGNALAAPAAKEFVSAYMACRP